MRFPWLKLPILLFGAAGLVLLLVQLDALAAGFEQAPLHTGLIAVGWAVAAAMGLLAIARPPLQPWHAAVALAGFAVVAIRTQLWRAIPSFGDAPIEGQLGMIALLGGLVASVLAVARPESEG